MRVDDVAGNEPGRYCSPRHRIPYNPRYEGRKCVSMTWRAVQMTRRAPPKLGQHDAELVGAALHVLGPLEAVIQQSAGEHPRRPQNLDPAAGGQQALQRGAERLLLHQLWRVLGQQRAWQRAHPACRAALRATPDTSTSNLPQYSSCGPAFRLQRLVVQDKNEGGPFGSVSETERGRLVPLESRKRRRGTRARRARAPERYGANDRGGRGGLYDNFARDCGVASSGFQLFRRWCKRGRGKGAAALPALHV
jgi:hypothetical protein